MCQIVWNWTIPKFAGNISEGPWHSRLCRNLAARSLCRLPDELFVCCLKSTAYHIFQFARLLWHCHESTTGAAIPIIDFLCERCVLAIRVTAIFIYFLSHSSPVVGYEALWVLANSPGPFPHLDSLVGCKFVFISFQTLDLFTLASCTLLSSFIVAERTQPCLTRPAETSRRLALGDRHLS